MRIGGWTLPNPVLLAPMAGITDLPFRSLCRQLGAGHAVSEMISSDASLRHSRKTDRRSAHQGEAAPVHVQIAGSDPAQMAAAARYNVSLGADLIDINMGCPARKVCHKLAGSALLRDEGLVHEIIAAVVSAVAVPVTLKTRTGWDRQRRNAVAIGRRAEAAGIACITLHGRARNDFYDGRAEFDTLQALRDAVDVPLVANGDIDDAATAARLLRHTGADAVMIGRAAQSRPWLPGRIAHQLGYDHGLGAEPDTAAKRDILLALVESLHRFYGADQGVRMARKHISWQLAAFEPDTAIRQAILRAGTADQQLQLLSAFLEAEQGHREAA